VSNGAQVITLLTQVAIGLSNGGNILVGQYFGAGNREDREETTGSFFTLFVLLGAVFAVGVFFLSRPFMTFMGAPALAEATAYLSAASWGLFFLFCYNAFAALLRAMGNSRTPMRCVVTAVLVNVALDILFVGPLGLGTAGAAWATVISQGLSCTMCFVYLLRHREFFSFQRQQLRPRWRKIRVILKLGIPCAVQMTVAGISWLVVTYLINDYGAVISAANAYSGKIKDLSGMFISAMSTAAASMVAQNLGAGLYDRGKQVMYTAMRMALCMAAVIILVVELTAPALVGVFTDDPQAIHYAALNLRVEILGQVFYAIFLVYHALMLGAGDTWWVFLSSFANCIVFRVILSITFEHFWGVEGIYAACAIAPSISVPVGMYYTHSGRWRKSLAQRTQKE
jgi:putative MATE family efflux protein